MGAEPSSKRAAVFVDGQNLFHAALAVETRFYTGIPDAVDDARWHLFWPAKLGVMGREGIHIVSRPLRYRNQTVRLPDGAEILSQDQDLAEVAEEIRGIALEQDRWIKIASAFPWSPTSRNRRGIDKTDWIRIDRALYDACLDRRDYRQA